MSSRYVATWTGRAVLAVAMATIAAIIAGIYSRRATSSAGADCESAPAPLPVVRIAHSNMVKETPGRRSLLVGQFADTELVRMGRNGIFSPALASRWETSDRRVWTFTLRDHLRTQQGVPLTAAAIVAALRAGMSRMGNDPIVRDLRSITSPTSNTIVFTLARPSSAFLEALAMLPIASSSGNATLYAGPFRVVSQRDEEIVYEAFPETWSGKPTVSGVHILFFPTPRAAWAALLRNEADFLTDVPVDATSLLAQNPDIRLIPNNWNFLFTLGFRVRHPLLRDARVRQALNLAIDREAIVDRFFGEYSHPAKGPFSRDFPAGDDLEERWPYDPALARKLLKEVTGGRSKPIELVCITSNQLPTPAGIAAMLATQLEQVNVQLRLVGVTVEEFNARMAKGDFDLFAAPIPVGPTSFWPYAYWHSNRQPLLDSGYTAADAALDALYTAVSPQAEAAAAVAVRDVMRRDPPAAFVAPVPNLAAVRRNWRIPDDDSNMIRTLPRWTLMESPGCASH